MESVEALAILAGLSQPTRLSVFRLLVETGPEGLPAGEIAAHLQVPATTLSFHLSHMHRAGLVISERHGTSIRYRADFDAMHGLVNYLTANCCGGDPQKCAPTKEE